MCNKQVSEYEQTAGRAIQGRRHRKLTPPPARSRAVRGFFVFRSPKMHVIHPFLHTVKKKTDTLYTCTCTSRTGQTDTHAARRRARDGTRALLTHQPFVEDEGGTDARRQPGADHQDERDGGICVVLLGCAHLPVLSAPAQLTSCSVQAALSSLLLLPPLLLPIAAAPTTTTVKNPPRRDDRKDLLCSACQASSRFVACVGEERGGALLGTKTPTHPCNIFFWLSGWMYSPAPTRYIISSLFRFIASGI